MLHDLELVRSADGPLIVRRADFRPSTLDREARTVEAIISTGSPYVRRDARGAYSEKLDLDAIEPAALVGVPVLDAHDQRSVRSVIGKVIEARRGVTGLVAKIQFSRSADVDPILDRLEDETLTGVSIGYRVQQWAERHGQSDERVRTAKQWTIHEVSLVAVPADAGAVVRSNTMPEEVITEEPAAPPVHNRAELRAQVRAIARSAGLTPEWADEHIDADADLTAVRAAAFEAMQNRNAPTIRTMGPSGDDPAIRIRAFEDALHTRVNGGTPSDEARPFMSHSLRDMARDMLHMRGVSTVGMDTNQLFRAAMHTTSDFPNLLTGVGRRTLMSSYEAAQSPVKALARQTTHVDFRAASKLKLSEVGPLQKVTEAGEIKSTSRGEAAESYKLDTYASIFAISRQALINDDLGAFRDWSVAAGRAAAETEANLLVTLLTANNGAGPVLGEDGENLFSAAHGNVASSGGDIIGVDGDLAALSEARKAMRDMKGLDGATPINAKPKFFLVGTDRETEAEQALATIAAATADTANPFSGKLTLLVEPRLPDTAWYVFADPAVLPILEYAYLSFAQGPQMASREGWDVLGTEFRVVLDFGAGAVDWRGAYRNAGE